jgi:hypothetical protein
VKNSIIGLALIALGLLAGCATAPPVDMSEPTRLLGQDGGVRINAQLFIQSVSLHTPIPVTYEIENLRDKPIAIADIVPETTFDRDSQTLTITLGSEVPGNEFLPKLVVIDAGSKKSFTTKGKVEFLMTDARSALPRYIRMKLNFLGEVAPFSSLVDIPEKAIHDPKLASEMFPKWIEANETVITNSVPIHWTGSDTMGDDLGRRPLR